MENVLQITYFLKLTNTTDITKSRREKFTFINCLTHLYNIFFLHLLAADSWIPSSYVNMSCEHVRLHGKGQLGGS